MAGKDGVHVRSGSSITMMKPPGISWFTIASSRLVTGDGQPCSSSKQKGWGGGNARAHSKLMPRLTAVTLILPHLPAAKLVKTDSQPIRWALGLVQGGAHQQNPEIAAKSWDPHQAPEKNIEHLLHSSTSPRRRPATDPPSPIPYRQTDIMADRGTSGPRGGGFASRGDRGGDRGRGRGGRGRGRRGGKSEEKEWQPVTKLGRLVKAGKIKSMEEIYLHSLPIKEYQIVDFFLPKLKDEVMKVRSNDFHDFLRMRMRMRMGTRRSENRRIRDIGRNYWT